MTLLVAVKSCQSHRGFHQAIRDTWGKHIPVRFFMGGDGEGLADETFLGCADDYHNLSYKTKAICRWSSERRYDYTFLCDTDTFVVPSRLLACGYEQYDYVGKINSEIGRTFPYTTRLREGPIEDFPECYPWASGGIGYFVSEKAARILAETEPITKCIEDLWVSQVLSPRSDMKILDHKSFNNYVSWHFPQGLYKKRYSPETKWMEQMYAEHIR